MKINARKTAREILGTRRPIFTSIRGRLYLLLFSVLIPVMLVQGGYLYARFKTRVESATRVNLEISRAVAITINGFVKDILHQETSIGATFTMPQAVSAVDEMNRILGLNKAEFPAVHSFAWLDPQGRVISSNLNAAVGLVLTDRDYLRKLMSGKEWVVGHLILSRATGKPVFTVSRAVRAKNGNLLGIVAAVVDPEKLGDLIPIHLAKDESITILDSHGMAVYQQPKREWNWEERKLIKARPAIMQALEGKEVSGIFPCSKTGKDWLVAIVPISSIGWAASFDRKREAVMAPITRQLLQEAVLFFLIIAGVFLGAFILSEGISRSIRRLLAHASALGGGDLEEPIEESGPAELRGLASAFNAMAKRVGSREKALKAAQERLFLVLEAIPASVYLQAPDCSIRFANRTFRETFGAPEGKHCYELLKGTSEPCENCDVLCCPNTLIPQQREWTDPGGKCYSIHTHPFTDVDGSPLVLKLSLDISELKRAWEAFRVSEGRYRELVQNANSAIMRVNGDGAITFFNEYAQNFFGYREDEVIGKHVGILLPEKESDGADLTTSYQDVASHPERYPHNINENIRRDGSRVWMAWTNKLLLDESGKTAGVLSVGTDITERRKAENKLLESERKLHSLSAKLLSTHEEERRRIAAELHDSFGSSLAAIKIGLETTRVRLARSEAGPELLDAPIAWTQLLIDEVRRLTTELRPPVLDDMGVIAALQWFFRQYRTTYPAIHIEEEIGIEERDIPEPLRIVIFRIVQEAFHNIAKYSNAEFVDFSLIKQDGVVKLTIEDNGDGFDLETVLSKTGERQGLGLTSMKERAEQAGGSFTIRSVPGTGTMLSAIWPLEFLHHPN